MVPQQWLAHTTAVGVDARDRRRLDLVIYGVSPRCCDATLVSPLTRSGTPQPRASEEDGAALRMAQRRKRATYPELLAQGPQRLLVLGSEIGGRWNDEALRLSQLAGPPCCAPASSPRVAAALVGAAFRCGAAGRWVHGLGPRMAGSASGPRPARAAAGARAPARRGCGREPPALARLSCLPRTRRGCWSVPAGVSLAMLGKRQAEKKVVTASAVSNVVAPSRMTKTMMCSPVPRGT